ncbi:TPA: lipopolysaccharide biosynthesis protein [Salmonella enterica subsp. enterica serovar Dublin]|nr:lipopolysaccharide biosynthesis protein [Salmonella enterica subsp. enterica serovar Dublin]
MIIEKKIKNYTVFVKKDGEKYIEIFKDFLSYNHQVIKVFRNIEDTKVVLINTDYGKYILKVFSPKVKNIKQSIYSLHQHGMVSGDPHKGNFILQGNEIRIIDLSGKRPSRQRKAKDRIDLERHYGIKNNVRDIGFYLLIYKKKLRNFLRRIKGKEKR